MKLQIFKILTLLNAAATAAATTAAGAPPLSNLNRVHGTNERIGIMALLELASIYLFHFLLYLHVVRFLCYVICVLARRCNNHLNSMPIRYTQL